MVSDVETVAFRMQLHPGRVDEYRRRHDEIWPELIQELTAAGVLDYRIFLDLQTHILFAVMTRHISHSLDALPHKPIMKRWWAMMADIMETNPDNSPVSQELPSMFQLTVK